MAMVNATQKRELSSLKVKTDRSESKGVIEKCRERLKSSLKRFLFDWGQRTDDNYAELGLCAGSTLIREVRATVWLWKKVDFTRAPTFRVNVCFCPHCKERNE